MSFNLIFTEIQFKTARGVGFFAGWYKVKLFWKLSTPQIHAVVVFLCDFASSRNILNCFPDLYFIVFKTMTVAKSENQQYNVKTNALGLSKWIVLFLSFSKIGVCRLLVGFVYGSCSECIFYEFTGIINPRLLTNQIARIISLHSVQNNSIFFHSYYNVHVRALSSGFNSV